MPDEVAITSLETEDLVGKAISPPISGVEIPVEEIGIKAAGEGSARAELVRAAGPGRSVDRSTPTINPVFRCYEVRQPASRPVAVLGLILS